MGEIIKELAHTVKYLPAWECQSRWYREHLEKGHEALMIENDKYTTKTI